MSITATPETNALNFKDIPESLRSVESEIIYTISLLNQALMRASFVPKESKQIGLVDELTVKIRVGLDRGIASFDPNNYNIHFDPAAVEKERATSSYLRYLLDDLAELSPIEIQHFEQLFTRLNRQYALLHESFHALATNQQEGIKNKTFYIRTLENHRKLCGNDDFLKTINPTKLDKTEEAMVDYFTQRQILAEIHKDWTEGEASKMSIDDSKQEYAKRQKSLKARIISEQIRIIEWKGYSEEKATLKAIFMTIAAKHNVSVNDVEKVAIKSLANPEDESFYNLVWNTFHKSYAQYFFEKLAITSEIMNYEPQVFED